MKRLGIFLLGLVGVIFLGSLAFGWSPWGHNGYHNGHGMFWNHQSYDDSFKEVSNLKKQIAEKQAELQLLYSKPNPDPKKIAQLENEIKRLYQKMNEATQGYYGPHRGVTCQNAPCPGTWAHHGCM